MTPNYDLVMAKEGLRGFIYGAGIASTRHVPTRIFIHRTCWVNPNGNKDTKQTAENANITSAAKPNDLKPTNSWKPLVSRTLSPEGPDTPILKDLGHKSQNHHGL